MKIDEEVANFVKEEFAKLGLTKPAFCKQAGVSVRKYYQIIKQEPVKPSTLNKVLGCFGCELVTVQTIQKINP